MKSGMKSAAEFLHISQNVEEDMPCFIGVGDGLDVLSLSHFMKSECELYPQFMKSGCGERLDFSQT